MARGLWTNAMKPLAGALVGILLTATVVTAQSSGQLYSAPRLPPRDDLDRLNLLMAWHTYLPMDGRRDGISNVQILANQVLVLLRRGMVLSLDPTNGHVQCRTRVGA